MSNDIGENFLLYSTIKELQDAIKDPYSSSENISKLFEIKAALYDLRQEDTLVTQYFNTLTHFWQQLDLSEIYSWGCAEDANLYKSIMVKKRTFKFHHGLNKDLDAIQRNMPETSWKVMERQGEPWQRCFHFKYQC